MAASYPISIKTFVAKVNLQDLVVAEDVNGVYDEVTAIETQLGAGGVATSDTWGSYTFSSATTNWGSLRLRLRNIEAGVYTAVTARVSTTGGSTVVPSSASTKGVIIKGAASQTANLLEFQNSSGTVTGSVNAAGAFVGVVDGGTA
jgi:hypothetical protein